MGWKSNIHQIWKDPKSLGREINRWGYRLMGSDQGDDEVFIFNEDWDNLIILDACRYDKFVQVNNLPGETHVRTSAGTSTKDFIKTNFSNRTLYDTVYASSNLWYPSIKDEIDSEVHKFIPIPDNSNTSPVLPSTVTERAISVANQFPNKRLIVHYSQPHYPYLGHRGMEIFDQVQFTSLSRAVRNHEDVTREMVRESYIENLELVLDEVPKLLSQLTGKIVVTADHGEMLGERYPYFPIRGFGHPSRLPTPELLQVPWHVIGGEERKEIVSEPPSSISSVSPDVIKSRLEALGYTM